MNARRTTSFAGERGVTLVETLVAIAILGAALTAFLGGLSTGSIATSGSERLSTAHEIARSQIEYVKSLPYAAPPASYPAVSTPPGYAVTADASSIAGADADIETVTVTVTRDGNVVYVLEGYKANR